MVYNFISNIFPKYHDHTGFSANNFLANNTAFTTDCVQRQNELVSFAGNQAVLSRGQAQITQNNLPKYDTTPERYISNLIKRGQIPNKNFTVNKSTRSDNRYAYIAIDEIDSNGKQTKETVFITDTPNEPKYTIGFVKLYNTETGLPYKRIAYSDKKDGTYIVDNFNPYTGEKVPGT